MFRKRLGRALAVTTIASLVISAAAFANDTLVADGDDAVSGAQAAVAFGNVCPSVSVTPADDNLTLWLNANNRSSANFFLNSTLVSINATSVPSNLSATDTSLTTSGTWQTAANGTDSVSKKVKISLLDAGTTSGANSATVTYTASGSGITKTNPSVQTGTVNRPVTVDVTWFVLNGSDPLCAAPNATPVLTVPADMTVEGNTLGGANVTYSVTASDDEDGDISSDATCSPASGSFFALGGPHTVSCSVTDSDGASANDSFSVTVVDTTGPVVTAPQDITVEGDTLGGASQAAVTAALASASATDVVWGSVSASYGTLPTLFSLGHHTVTYTALDGSGSSGSDTTDVNVVDTTGPVVTAPDDITVEGDTTGGALQSTVLGLLGTASANDVVWGDVSNSLDDGTLPAVFPLGQTTITYTAQDGSSNIGSDTTVVTVADTTDPVISGMPSNINTTTMNSSGKAVSWIAPSASDIVDSNVPVICSPASGSTFPIGTTTVNCTATDDSGNSASASFTVTVGLLSASWKEPINGPSVINVAKAGRVIPVKVEVFLDGVENVDTGTVTFRLYKSSACTAGAQDAVEAFAAAGDANAGDLFRWDSTGGFYIYNLKTPSTTGCYSGEVLLNGERAGYFLINLTK